MTSERKSRGAGDPGRRQRLVETALTLMMEHGVAALSHRAVAAAAQVPLGSTTYYFKDLDALLLAAMDELTQRTHAGLTAWSDRIPAKTEMAERLARMMHAMLTRQRAQTTLSYELYLLAMRRPALRASSTAWMDVLRQILLRHLDAARCDAVVAMADGIIIQGLVAPAAPGLASIKKRLALLI